MRFVLDIACIIVVGVNLPFAVYGYLLFAETTEGTECFSAYVCVWEMCTIYSLHHARVTYMYVYSITTDTYIVTTASEHKSCKYFLSLVCTRLLLQCTHCAEERTQRWYIISSESTVV